MRDGFRSQNLIKTAIQIYFGCYRLISRITHRHRGPPIGSSPTSRMVLGLNSRPSTVRPWSSKADSRVPASLRYINPRLGLYGYSNLPQPRPFGPFGDPFVEKIKHEARFGIVFALALGSCFGSFEELLQGRTIPWFLHQPSTYDVGWKQLCFHRRNQLQWCNGIQCVQGMFSTP